MRQMGILRDADKERMPLGGDVGTSGRYREMIDSNQYNETYGSGKIGPPRVKAPSNSAHPTLHRLSLHRQIIVAQERIWKIVQI
jgi:hypothetical protein